MIVWTRTVNGALYPADDATIAPADVIGSVSLARSPGGKHGLFAAESVPVGYTVLVDSLAPSSRFTVRYSLEDWRGGMKTTQVALGQLCSALDDWQNCEMA